MGHSYDKGQMHLYFISPRWMESSILRLWLEENESNILGIVIDL